MTTRDELLWALHARIASFTMMDNRSAVLAPEAAGLARALMSCVPDPSRDREAVLAVADLYRLRSLLLDDAGGQDAAIAAALTRMAGTEQATPASAAAESMSAETQVSVRRLIEMGRRANELIESADDPRALTEAVRVARVAADAVPAGLLAFRGPALANLGRALLKSYERTGSPPDLHDAVRATRAAEAATVDAHLDRAAIVSQLGVVLRTRYERAGAMADLEKSIECARQAADATPAGDFNHGGRLSNLGIALRLRYKRTGRQRDLDEAVTVCRKAVSVTGPDHPGYSMFQTGLGNALRARYDSSEDAADLAELVALDEQAVKATPPGAVHRSKTLLNLASSLTQRYEAKGADDDADRAEALLREALADLSEGHALLSATHYELGRVLWAKHDRRGRRHDLDAAVSCARTAALQPTGLPLTRLRAAVAWGRWAMTAADAREALAGYEQAIELLPSLIPRSLARGDAEHALSRFPGLASDAAACAIAAGDPERAVTLLEQGRGILLAQDLQVRDDVAELRDHAPGLAAQFADLRTALAAGDVALDLAGAGETAADVRHVLAADWERLLASIRALPGFAHFLHPPPFERLLDEAAPGPVILVNVSRHRCDAMLLDSGGLRVVPLPGLTLEGAVRQAVDFLTILEQLTTPGGANEAALSARLAWLWDTVASPVLDALGLTGPPAPGADWPRVWWIPTGPLAFLPLHAAGYHGAADGRSVLDRAVSSYTPTLRTLANARRPAAHRTGSFLLVAVSDAPGASPLPGAADEANKLATMLPGARLLQDSAATRDAVLAGIKEHGWLHFSGHGSADPAHPSKSQLIVQDYAAHPLTVSDISRLNLPAAELAYLSACTTARSGFGLADEALHIASAMQLAGYRHVVGTLWVIGDQAATFIAERVYAALGAPDPTADLAADAVHAAVREVRNACPAMPSLWAAHVHVGA